MSPKLHNVILSYSTSFLDILIALLLLVVLYKGFDKLLSLLFWTRQLRDWLARRGDILNLSRMPLSIGLTISGFNRICTLLSRQNIFKGCCWVTILLSPPEALVSLRNFDSYRVSKIFLFWVKGFERFFMTGPSKKLFTSIPKSLMCFFCTPIVWLWQLSQVVAPSSLSL